MPSNLAQLLVAFLMAAGSMQTAVPAQQAQPSPLQADLSYQIGPGDVLNIKVFDEPSLSGLFPVESDGTISYPFLLRVNVQGKTVRDVESDLTKRLLGNYLQNPQVTVDIANYRVRSIYVLGDVRTPGKYDIEGQVTLLEVIAKAGSLTSTAGNVIIVQRPPKDAAGQPALPGDGRAQEVMRVTFDDLREGRFVSNILLQDGDTLFVPKADVFFVTGFVKSPGFFVLQPNMTVRQAIAVAGGLTERGSTRGIKIIRRVKDREVEVSAGMGDLVRPGDTIRVRQRLL
ncbi:MAG TPA: polysaccharide biosynthesis/export family protein [Vicinamibacterales bacterium]|nr:polysaccharide biosynthesis/export family protein [Vicinamibacterales bacterium]